MDKFPSRERTVAAALEPRVSAIIVTRNAESSLDLCLRSVFAEPWIDDVVIVDHGNPPAASASLRAQQADRRDVKVVQAGADLSYAAAANLGAERARGRWLMFLDPHVVMQRGAAPRLAAAGASAPSPWIIGGRLVDLEGRERRAARAGALNAWSAVAVAMDWPGPRPLPKPTGKQDEAQEPARVAAVSGAFMLIPRADFNALGGFDAGFATHGADLDLCRRAAEAGGAVLFQSAATGVQFLDASRKRRRKAQGLALFALKSARTPGQKAFALVARPALAVLLALMDFVAGRPPTRR